MTPDITPFLLAADREHPELRTVNTAQSCFQLLKRALEKAGPEWAFVGKTDEMDGGKVYVAGFQPLELDLVRPDGQRQRVRITAVSMDSAWHIPSGRQVKVIANSSANDDPNPAIHGPAQLTPYVIEPPEKYRWHNPPIAQALLGSSPAPTPAPVPTPVPVPALKPRQRFFDELAELNAFYASADGLQRPGGMVIDRNGVPTADVEALGAWGYNLMAGATVDECKAQIRTSAEWKSKHP